jgi:hypothetical protein
VAEICTFSTFTHVCQTYFAYNFFGAFFRIFFYPFQKKIFGHISTFFYTRKKLHQKSKNVLSKCVLDLNFAPIKGLRS